MPEEKPSTHPLEADDWQRSDFFFKIEAAIGPTFNSFLKFTF